MLGGVTTRWKQTVAYYLTGNSTDGSVMADIVVQITARCYDIVLNVICLKLTWGLLTRQCGKNSVVSNKEEVTNAFQHRNAPCDSVVVMADVPHLKRICETT